jgi:hypothetical protein
MDSYSMAREVEKVKPFAHRAEDCCSDLAKYQGAIGSLIGHKHDVVRTLAKAEALLMEAVRRGVKGKDGSE